MFLQQNDEKFCVSFVDVDGVALCLRKGGGSWGKVVAAATLVVETGGLCISARSYRQGVI